MRAVFGRILGLAFVTLAVVGLSASEGAPPRPHIRGRVTDAATGAPLPDAQVVLVIYPPGPGSFEDPESISDAEILRPELDPEARFDLGVPDGFEQGGRIVMVASARAHADYAVVPSIWMGDSPPQRLRGADLELVAKLRGAATYEGVVTDESGHPVPGVRISSCNSVPEGVGHLGSYPFDPLNWPAPEISDTNGRWRYHAIPDGPGWRDFGARVVIWLERDGMLPVILASPDKLPVSDGVIPIRTTMHPGRTLSGAVVDSTGAPVEGATITASSWSFEGEPYGVSVTSEGRSDKNGHFVLSGLGDRPYAFVARHKGLRAVMVQPADPHARPPTLTIHLDPGCDLAGRLVRADGRPLRRIWINAIDPKTNRSLADTRTSEDGSFTIESLPRGMVTLQVGSPSVLERHITLPAATQALRLPARRELIVKFRDISTGRTVPPRGYVRLEPSSAELGARYGQPNEDDSGLSFGLVPAGSYTLRAKLDGFIGGSKSIRVDGGAGPPQVLDLDLRPGFLVTGHVSDSSGAPISGARIYAQGLGRGNSSNTTTGPDGSYRLDGLDDTTGIVGTAYVFMARAEGKAPSVNFETFSRVSFFDRRLDFVLSDGGTVRGRVTRQDGSPVSGAVVRVKGRELFWTLPMIYRVGYADADGRYALEHVPTGDVAIVVDTEEQVVLVTDHGESAADFVVATPKPPAR
jgi:protocatechuate 3,4-dioxygenase beta subunit